MDNINFLSRELKLLIKLSYDLILPFELLIDLLALTFQSYGYLVNLLDMLILLLDQSVLVLSVKHLFIV